LIGCLDRPSSGRITVLGTDVAALDKRAGAAFRGRNIGFIFQDFNLVPVLTVYENVEYPLVMVQRWPEAKRRARVMSLLDSVGMSDQAKKFPDQLSGGQRQRVAVARALAPESQLVLADEPTANLDHDTAARVLSLMRRLRDEYGVTFLFSTHDPKVMAEAETIFHLEDGRLMSVEETGAREKVHA
jgi:putative ABC transport system ATP-binding protein